MRERKLPVSILAICCFLCSHLAHGAFELIDRTVAFVGDRVILESDLENYACYVSMKTREPVSDLNERELLDALIDEIVLFQEALKTGMQNGEGTSETSRIEELKHMTNENGPSCDRPGFDESYIAERLRREEVVSDFIRNRIEIFVNIADRDVRRYFVSTHGGSEEGYNEDMKVKYEAELKRILVEKELADYLARIKKRIKIIIPED